MREEEIKNENGAEVEQSAESAAVGTYVFKKPTKIDGEEEKEISYDLTLLNGGAIRRAKAELTRRGYHVAVKELDEVYHTALFAQVTGLTIDNVDAFSAVDYMEVADIVRNFLTAQD